MNQQSWDNTPDDLKPLIEEVCSNPFRTSGGLTQDVYDDMMRTISDSGVDLYHVAKENQKDMELWSAAFQDATRNWVQKLEKKGLPAKETVKHYYEVIKTMDIEAPGIPQEWIAQWGSE